MISLNVYASQSGPSLVIKSGGVYFHSKNRHLVLLLPNSENVNDFLLSPNNKWFVFVKRGRIPIPKSCSGFYDPHYPYGKEIWIINLTTMKKRLLVENNFSYNHLTKMIIDPSDLKFSPDSKTLFFEVSAWDTSDAIHSVNVDSEHLKYVTDGNDYRVVLNGRYSGDLIVNQHRYHDQGGSYDWDWLFSPSGKQIKLYKKED